MVLLEFVPPTWWQGLGIWVLGILLPLICGFGIFMYTVWNEKHVKLGTLLLLIGVLLACLTPVMWHECYEVPSVQEKVVTVENWQPLFGKYWGEIDGAGDLMMETTDGELFLNKESFLFNKFDTRDVFDNLKPNGTYKIKYYGWREGFRNGAPNILSIEQVIDESNATNHNIGDYMNKRSIIYDDYDHY